MSDPLAAARALQPKIREAAAEIERERRLPPSVVGDLRGAGLFQMLIPRSLGGPEVDPVTAAEVVEEVALADGSAGWCVMIAAQNAMLAGFLPEEHAREIWSNDSIVAGTARPTGRAVATRTPDDGFVVSGRWPFASGSSHADWFMGECVVYDGETPRKDAQGNTVTRAVFVPRANVTIHDTWNTTGLRGTASNDFSVEGVFVPRGRGFQMIVDPPIHPGRMYRATPLVFMNHGSQALGVARSALMTATEIMTTRRGWGDQPLREMPRLQSIMAEATALVESARSYLYQSARDLWAATDRGADQDPQPRARLRLAASHATRASMQAVDLVHAAVGTSAIFVGNPIERQFRDIHTAAAHVMIGPLVLEAAGRVQLGLSPDFPFF